MPRTMGSKEWWAEVEGQPRDERWDDLIKFLENELDYYGNIFDDDDDSLGRAAAYQTILYFLEDIGVKE